MAGLLIVEREPSDEAWLELLASLDVRIAWPDVLVETLADLRASL
jgi:hypothetical protein